MARLTSLMTAGLAGVALLVTGCAKNPADDVAKADTSAVKSVPDEPPGAPADAAVTKYTMTTDSTIGFVGSKVTGSHEGGFKTFAGQVSVADGALAGIEVAIDMASTWSDNERLTGHLKSADFFDVAKFSESTFVLTSAAKGEGNQYRLAGNFTLHGVTKQISFPATVGTAEQTVTIQAEFAINRLDFGISYPGKADDLIRKEVVIKVDVKAERG